MEKTPKKKRSFTIRPEVFIKLKVYSSTHGISYSSIIEGLVDRYITDPNAFPPINFDKYK